MRKGDGGDKATQSGKLKMKMIESGNGTGQRKRHGRDGIGGEAEEI